MFPPESGITLRREETVLGGGGMFARLRIHQGPVDGRLSSSIADLPGFAGMVELAPGGNVALRGLLGPVGWLALVVGVLALVHVAGTGRPRQEIVRLFIMLGASAAALSDLIYLSHIAWWGPGAIQATPDLIALGRAFEVVDSVGHYLQWAGFLVLALGLICL